MSFNLIANLGLDTQQFSRSLKGAERGVNRFQGLMSKIGITAGAMTITRFFMQVVRNARDAEGELDKNTAAVKRFADSMDSLSAGVMRAGTNIVGTLNRIGETIGNNISILFGATHEQIREAERASKGALEAEQRLAEVRAKHAAEAARAAEIQESNAKKLIQLRRAEMSEVEALAARERDLLRIRERIADLDQPGRNLSGGLQRELAELKSQELDIEIQIARERQNGLRQTERETEAIRVRLSTLKEEMKLDRLSDAEQLIELETRRIQLLETREKKLWENTAEAARDFSQAELDILENLKAQEAIRERIAAQEKRDAEIIESLQIRIAEEQAAAQLSRLDGAARLEEITRRIANLNQLIDATREEGNEAEALQLTLQRNRLEQDRLTTEERITEQLRLQREEMQMQLDRKTEIARRESQSFRERSTVTLAALASGRFGRGAASDARRVQEIESRAQQARTRGNEALADRLTSEALQRRSGIAGLSQMEADPQKAFRDALEDTNEAIRQGNEKLLAELNQLRTGPVNGGRN